MNTRLMIVFPGQGTQNIGMYSKLTEGYDKADYFIKRASKVSGLDLEHIIEHSDKATLSLTQHAQAALLLTEYVTYRKLAEQYELNPVFMAGHSLGEITALTCCGALDFSDAITLVTERGKLMSEINGGVMAAIVGIEAEVIEKECKKNGQVVVSNYNSPNQTVIAGVKSEVELVANELTAMGAKVKFLDVSGAFHSFHMESITDRYVDILDKINGYYFQTPVISNYDARPYSLKKNIRERLRYQLTNAVQWTETLKYAEKMGINTIIEIGPGRALKGLSKLTVPSIQVYSISGVNDEERLKDILKEKKVKGCDYTKLISRSMAIAVSVENKNDNPEEYEMGVVEVYHRIQKLKEELDNRESEATEEEARNTVKNLITILKTKKASNEIIRMRVYQLLNETFTLESLEDLLYI